VTIGTTDHESEIALPDSIGSEMDIIHHPNLLVRIP
jgi:hypothetical protein